MNLNPSSPACRLLSGLLLVTTAMTALAETPSIEHILAHEERASGFDHPDWERGFATVTVGSAGDGCDYTSLQAAINAVPATAIARINLANTGNYFGGTYLIQDKSVRIVGGYDSCSAGVPTGTTTLNANSNGRVFHIIGSANPSATVLENLIITNGSGDNEGGGGIRIEGRPGLLGVRLINTSLNNNQSAVDGGAIKVVATDEQAPDGLYPTLLELANTAQDNNSISGQTVITQNSAERDGGGIACRSSSTQFASPTVRIDRGFLLNNSAGRDGGGISSVGCSLRLYLASPTVIGGLMGNAAGRNGGGLSQEGSLALIYGGVQADYGYSGYASMIRNNSAIESGGGIYVHDGTVQARSIIVDGNKARRGAGLASYHGAFVNLIGESGQTCAEPANALAGFALCNRIQNNEITLSGEQNNPGGAAWYVHLGQSRLDIDRTLITGNFQAPIASGGAGVRPSVGFIRYGQVNITNSVLSGNSMGQHLISMVNFSSLDIRYSTIADNSDLNRVIDLDSSTELHVYIGSSIIHQPGAQIFVAPDYVEGSRQMRCVIGHQDSSELDVTTLAFYSQIDPEFADPANGDFRPGPNSPAIDYCDDFDIDSNTTLDFAHQPRGLGWPDPITAAPNRIPDGVYDLGAWELQPDRLFRDRFEN